MGLDPLQFVFQFPEGLAVNEGDAGELRHHLLDGRLSYRTDVGDPLGAVYIRHLVHLNTGPNGAASLAIPFLTTTIDKEMSSASTLQEQMKILLKSELRIQVVPTICL